MRALIVDDERLARQRLRRLLRDYADVEIVGECEDGAAAIECTRKHTPDLLLLDIQMPGMDGFDVVEALEPVALPLIIFVTAYDEYAVRAFEACALDYLLKPVTAERLNKAIARAGKRLEELLAENTTGGALPEVASAKRFHVRSGQETSFIAPEEIDWIEASGNYAILHVGLRNHLLRVTMSVLEGDLPPEFLRTSRSSIVNLRQVKTLQSANNAHFAVMQNDVRVPVTSGVRDLQDRLRRL